MATMSDASVPAADLGGSGRLRLAAAAGAALVVALAVSLLLGADEGGDPALKRSPAVPAIAAPEIVDVAGLRSLSASLDRPIYWAGDRTGARMGADRRGGRPRLRALPR